MDKFIERFCYLLLMVMTAALFVDGSFLLRLRESAKRQSRPQVLIDLLKIDNRTSLHT